MRTLAACVCSVALATASWTVTRASQPCEFHVSPVRVELDAAQRSGSISVETQPGCSWTADSSAGWLHVGTSGGTGSGIIPYDVTAAPANPPLRQGAIRVRWNTPTAGQNVLVTQTSGTCDAFFYPAPGPLSARTVGWKGGGRTVWTLADPPFSGPWRFVSAPDWIAFTSPPLGVLAGGDGTAFFVAVPNPSPTPRDGTVTFCSGAAMTVHQSGRSLNGGRAAAADFDGDGISDPAVFRATGTWYALLSSTGYSYGASFTAQFGANDWTPVPGDYDGDNKTDLAFYNALGPFADGIHGSWNLRYSSNGYDPATETSYDFPTRVENYSPQSLPLVADFNGDGKPDFVTFKRATGEWSVRVTDWQFQTRLPDNFLSGGEYNGHWQWGLAGDIPVPADYDGDGFAELAVWRPSNGVWYLRMSSNGYQTSLAQMYQWGLPGDIPIVGDFDGDGRTDLAVWRPSNGSWYIVHSSSGYSPALMTQIQWGLPGDAPLSGRIIGAQ